ncbi:disulfide bond formation protein B [Vogesella sp. LIG4]|uniref:disulfide bond formation protein B n=1 Tax=Vogesella sp. LIG4 TaxID=1192162 RepID=UPI00081FF99A|nr:disulfide bond formation protein B [Vogesella sp. LIG4]SCK26942.1 disulfide bond formation protein DsbB [Vogesella sp. LIG4]
MSLTQRQGFAAIAVVCVAAMGFALYAQHVLGLEPCPLCIFQRVGVIATGVLAALFALINPRQWRAKLAAVLVALASVGGGLVSSWHVYLQHLPKGQVPACGPGLDFMMETLPLQQVVAAVFKGSGECAEITWTFLGQSMPVWTGLLFVALIVFALWNGWRQR